MGAGRQKRELERQSQATERIANTQQQVANQAIQNSQADRERQDALFQQILPVAQMLIGQYDPNGYNLEFPDIQRPEFKDMIRRDYMDDRAGIEQAKNAAVAQASDYYTASGLGRTGIATGGLGAIARGANQDLSMARRNMQGRNEAEDRDAYMDRRDLALLKHQDARMANSERANLATTGANILAGQQGVFNAQGWHNSGQSGYGSAASTMGQAGNMTTQAGQLPGMGRVLAGVAGGVAGAALGNPAGLSSIWRTSRPSGVVGQV